MLKFNFTKLFKTSLIASLLLLIRPAFAGETLSFNNTGSNNSPSDYNINVVWSGVFGSYCECGGTTYLYAMDTGYAKSSGSGWIWGVSQSYNGPSSGSNNWIVGPGYSDIAYVTFWYTGSTHNSGCTCTPAPPLCPSEGCDQPENLSPPLYPYTAEIYSPVGLTATNGNYVDYVDLAWSKGSYIPDSLLQYKVYRDNVLIATLPATGSNLTYRDSNLSTSTSYSYYVVTYTAGWNGHTSAPTYATGATYSADLQATKGTEYGKTTLTWLNLATYAPNDIQVSRNGQQIAVVNKNSTTYDDFNGVPGVKYLYSVAPINANNQILPSYNDSGYSKPNGVLSGYVRSILGAGVPGVAVTATATVDGQSYSYSDSTDATGYYAINNIFYDTAATYTVVASRGHDHFNPASISRNINIQNYNNSLPDIIDTTVFTIQGQVLFANTTNCAVQGASLYVNGSNTNILTDGGGNYAYTALTPGTYVLSIKYANHTFDSVSRTVTVNESLSGINFHDTKVDTLLIDLKSGCHSQVCDSAYFQVISDPGTANAGCFSASYRFDGFDPVVVVLPAMKYQVQIPTAYDNGPDLNIETVPNGPNDNISIDLTQRDTFYTTGYDTTFIYTAATRDTLANGTILYTPADTIIGSIDTVNTPFTPYQAARFVYHGPLAIQLTQVDSFCGGYVVNQGQPIPVGIYVHENSLYNGHYTSCLQDTGTVRIFDAVSGAGLSYGQLVNGELVYELIPGQPNVPDAPTDPHQYQELFNVFVSAGSQSANLDAWMLIQGNKTLTATFISKSPSIPLMVLHRPPGSASYSSLQKDSSMSLNIANLVNHTSTYGGYAQIQVGKVEVIPLAGINIPGVYFNAQVQGSGGYSKDSNQTLTMTVTANQTISTSSDPAYVGINGDVFVGGTMDTKYAYAYQLNLNSCVPTVDTVLLWGLDSVESTFIYPYLDIQQTILPQLQGLLAAAPDTSKSYFQSQINAWNEMLANDSATIANANYTQNISFSAGASYDYSVLSDSNFQNTFNYTYLSNASGTVGGGISDAQLININAGFQWQTSYTHGADTTGTSDQNITFDYHLEDDVPGNFYSVNIGYDPHYGSPIFKLFAGTSGCPWEPGTQHRDVPTLTIAPGEIDNVPPTSPASFVAYLGNQSESQETRTYQVSVAPETNLDGATIKIGGQDITQNPASFTIGYANVLTTALTVQEGPFAADYNDIAISLSSSCDPNISVTVPITVHFQSTCSDVSLALPNENWLANSSNNDTLYVAFTGFNASNPNLQFIGLQYRLSGSTSTWSTGPEIPVAQLTQQYVTIPFNITNLPDGNYQIRAFASCGAVNGGITYSATLDGVIDRSSFTLYGTPTPSNGVLNLGENISVQFNNDIDCNQTYEPIQITLTRDDNGAFVPDTFTCFGTGLVINTYPASLLDSLDGVTLTANVSRVHDINGNLQSSPVSWSFLVSRSQVFWSPANINATAVLGTGPTVTATMTNVGRADTFTIVQLPSWLTVTQAGPYALTQGTPQSPSLFPLSFTVLNSLNEGHYSDTVVAMANGKRLLLFVTLDVVTQAPNWTVNANNFQYSMNITTNYSKTSQNAPLSTDTRDIIAAFVGNQCRGVGNIVYNAVSNTYSAFITAYSNSAVGDTFTFRMWDALPGIEYQAVERLPFITDGSIGQPQAPYILHPAGEFQTVTFSPGWNWFSLNVTNSDMSPANVLSSITGNNGAVVKTQNVYDQFTTAATGWRGTLNAFSTNTSYMIDLDHADTLHFLGQLVTDTSIVQIASGWNWVGFPRHKTINASSYLSAANSSNGDILKSQTEFTQYNAGNWAGSLNYMYPGQGYKLRSTNAYNFVIPPDRSLPNWNVNQNLFEQNMTVTADLQFNGTSTTQSNYLVGAFANGICVGTAQPEFIASLNLYRVFLSIQGDTGNAYQALSFKVYDTDNDIEYEPTYLPVSIVPDTIVAKVEAPYVINVQTTTGINALTYTDGFSLMQNVPNPFSKTTSIDYTIPTEQQVTIILYDESGRLIRELVSGTQAAGKHSVSFEQDNLQAGVYLYQMKAGEFVKTRRMLILE